MTNHRRPEPNQPDIVEELRRRDQPVPDAPATIPHPGEGIEPGDVRPSEDGGVEQHPIHDSDIEDLGPEDYEELTDEVERAQIKPDR